MNFIYDFIPEELIRAIGWTIFHSLWQGTIISVILCSAFFVASKKSAQLRYYFALAALFVMFIVSTAIFIQEYNSTNKTNLSITELKLFSSPEESKFSSEETAGIVNPESDIIENLKNLFSKNISAVVTFWILGFLVLSSRFLGGLFYVQKLRAEKILPAESHWHYRVKELSGKLKIQKAVALFESAKVKVPVAVGYLKPMILLPLGMLNGLPADQVEAIIIHELVHIKRYDFVLNLIQIFIETILFYHPAAWWISSIIKNERENCCDDITLNLCGGSLVYFKALFNLQQICSEENSLALAAVGKRNQLFRRINRMNSNNKNTSFGAKFAVFASLLVLIAVVSIYSTSAAKDNQRKNFIAASFVNPFVSLKDNNTPKISSEEIALTPDTTSIKKGKRTIKFYDDIDGKEKRFKAKLNNGIIEELYIDGEKVADKDLSKYENMVSENVDEYDACMAEFKINMDKFKANMNKLKTYMKKFRGSISHKYNYDYDFDFDFDIPNIHLDTLINKKVLRNIQKHLQNSFSKHSFNIPPIHIPKIDLPPIHVPHFEFDSLNFHMKHFDNSGFKASMKEWSKKFKKEIEKLNDDNGKFKMEMEKFKEEMKKFGPGSESFKKSMDELKKNMSKLKTEMKILKEYLKDVKSELVNDNLIDEDDDLDGFYLSKTEMKVNGKKVSTDLHKKYLALYKKHYGKDLTDDQKINFD